jgi:hypothetical protein
VQGLWGGPFLREVHGLSPTEAGNVLLVAVIAYQVGTLAFGPLIISILATLALASHTPIWVPIDAMPSAEDEAA